MAVILTLGLMLGIRQPITGAERPALPRRCLLDVQLGAISWRESSSYQIAVTTLHPGRKGGGPPKALWSDGRVHPGGRLLASRLELPLDDVRAVRCPLVDRRSVKP